MKTLLSCDELHKYDRARIFLDEDYTASDKFTALGSLYFIHEEVQNVLIWDFVDCKFIEVEGREVLSGNIENVPIKEKAKFPQHFFPEFKWSRKGFLRTRWSVNNCIFDLVNIHLFHDASNIVAMESSPSVYSENRQRALLHTLQRFENDKYSKVPIFIYGDFNFRLDTNLLIQELTSKLVAQQFKGKKDQVNKIEYSEKGNGKVLLTIGSKSFDYYDKHTDLFTNMNKWLHQYDKEFSAYRDQLIEFEITFPPSYPFCEDVADGISYMKTRVPSWCDRVLLTHSAKEIIVQDLSHPVVYDIIGKDSCMGDHKPVYLFFHMRPGKGKSSPEGQALPESLTTSEPLRQRTRTLSINGELVGSVDINSINIHDFAVFEQEQNLLGEFRESIKNKLIRSSNNELGVPSMERKRSFQDIARNVRTMEKVLLQWPRRRSDRHHSSSSEDYPSDESESRSLASNELENVSKGVDSLSVDLNENNRSGSDLQTVPPNYSKAELPVRAMIEQEIVVTVTRNTEVEPNIRGCGDDGSEKTNVVRLAEHDGRVHVDSSTHPTSSNPSSYNLSGGEQRQSGKIDETSPASGFLPGCCSCVLF
ncbi:Type I inositol 1,4,5-trisphosphate 5-phosphatase [Bulinus truncatus]|nr:Type I inositol 1,4,5-trisphosphate 5-phosphatase [Bulinus truncatus]